MTTEATLSIADAVSLLATEHNEPETVAGAEEATQQDNEFFPQDDPDLEGNAEDEPETAIEDDVEGGEGDEPDSPAIEAPTTWNAEDKADFAKMSREAQEIALRHDQRRNKALNEALERAATSRKTAEAEAQTIARQRSELEQLLPQVKQKYASRWAHLTPQDWAVAYQQDPIQAAQAEAIYKAEKAELTQLEELQGQVQQAEIAKYKQGEIEAFVEIAKRDPVAKKFLGEANTVMPEIAKYLLAEGFDNKRTEYIAAKELLMVYKSYQYDRLMSEREQRKSAPNTAHSKPSSAGTRMRAPTTSGTTQQKSQIETQSRRLAQTGSIEDAVALLNMKTSEARKGR